MAGFVRNVRCNRLGRGFIKQIAFIEQDQLLLHSKTRTEGLQFAPNQSPVVQWIGPVDGRGIQNVQEDTGAFDMPQKFVPHARTH